MTDTGKWRRVIIGLVIGSVLAIWLLASDYTGGPWFHLMDDWRDSRESREYEQNRIEDEERRLIQANWKLIDEGWRVLREAQRRMEDEK